MPMLPTVHKWWMKQAWCRLWKTQLDVEMSPPVISTDSSPPVKCPGLACGINIVKSRFLFKNMDLWSYINSLSIDTHIRTKRYKVVYFWVFVHKKQPKSRQNSARGNPKGVPPGQPRTGLLGRGTDRVRGWPGGTPLWGTLLLMGQFCALRIELHTTISKVHVHTLHPVKVAYGDQTDRREEMHMSSQ